MSSPPGEVDLVVVGAGPAGIALVAEARAAGVAASRILVIEKSDAHSFTIRKYYPQGKPVLANYKGFVARCDGVLCIPDLSREETLTYLDRAILDSGAEVRYRQEVHKIAPLPDGRLRVSFSTGEVDTRVVVLAIGILGRPNKPKASIPRAVAKRVVFDVTSEEMRGLDILVIGGGDTATEYVQFLVQAGNRVTLSYRGRELNRPNPINRDSVLALESQGLARILWGSEVAVFADSVGHVGKVKVKFAEPEHGDELFDRVVCALGGTTPVNFLKAVGIEFEGPRPRLTDGFATSVPGLYLAGDLTAGGTGGSIILAFNTAAAAMRDICETHGICAVKRPE